MIMTYMATGTLTEIDDLMALKELLVANNWMSVTALCVIVFLFGYIGLVPRPVFLLKKKQKVGNGLP